MIKFSYVTKHNNNIEFSLFPYEFISKTLDITNKIINQQSNKHNLIHHYFLFKRQINYDI